jgi:hypothetical protein
MMDMEELLVPTSSEITFINTSSKTVTSPPIPLRLFAKDVNRLKKISLLSTL